MNHEWTQMDLTFAISQTLHLSTPLLSWHMQLYNARSLVIDISRILSKGKGSMRASP